MGLQESLQADRAPGAEGFRGWYRHEGRAVATHLFGVASGLVEQRRPGFHGERVGRYVRRIECDRLLQRGAPVVERLTRRAVDEIEVDALDACGPRTLHCNLHVRLVVVTPEHGQDVGDH